MSQHSSDSTPNLHLHVADIKNDLPNLNGNNTFDQHGQNNNYDHDVIVTVAEIEIVTVIVTLIAIVNVTKVNPLTTVTVDETTLDLDLVTDVTEKVSTIL